MVLPSGEMAQYLIQSGFSCADSAEVPAAIARASIAMCFVFIMLRLIKILLYNYIKDAGKFI